MADLLMTITRIDSLDDPRIDSYARLTGRQLKSVINPGDASIICESLYVIQLAARLGLAFRSVLVDERHLQRLLDLIPSLGDLDIPIYVASREVMSGIVGFRVTRGYLACVDRPRPASAEDILSSSSRIAVVEGLVDVSNMGALFRSAAALGVDGVLLAPTCADPLSRRSIRVSMGTVFQVPWAPAPLPWAGGVFEALRAHGFESVAMALDDRAVPLGDPSLAKADKLALFFGTEGTGLTEEVLASVDRTVIIPMSHGVDSLNVAASSAVAFWELCARPRA